jgi:hypothetical protein
MRKKKSVLPAKGFIPASESSLSNEWILNEDVMKTLKCSLNTLKKHRDDKLLPFGKLGGRIYHNTADVQHLLIMLRRLSLALLPHFIGLIDYTEV